MYTISLITDTSGYGRAVQNILSQRPGAQDFADRNGCLCNRVQQAFGDVKALIESTSVVNEPATLRNKFSQKLDENHQLIIFFNESSAVNPTYRVGDLVVHDFKEAPLPNKKGIKAIAATLPELKLEGFNRDEYTQRVLLALSTGEKSYIEVREQVQCEQSEWKAILDKVIAPMRGVYIEENKTNFRLSLNVDGQKKLQTLLEKGSKKPDIHFGDCLTEYGLYTISSSSAPIRTSCAVQDMVHGVLEAAVHSSKPQTKIILHISAIKVMSDQDREESNGYEQSVAEIFLKFVQEFVQMK
jgi:hypothetical protein